MKTRRIHTALTLAAAALLGAGCGAEGVQREGDVAEGAQALTSELVIYDDNLRSSWYSDSWIGDDDVAATSPVQSGVSSVAVTFQSGWDGFVMQTNSAVDASSYNAVRFFIHGGTSGAQKVSFKVKNGVDAWSSGATVTLAANEWLQKDIPLSDLGSPSQIKGLLWKSSVKAGQPMFYIDQVALVNTAPQPPPPDPLPGSTQLKVYDDALASGWQSWSWNTTVDAAATSPVQSGQKSISGTFTGAWGELRLHAGSPVDAAKYDHVRFWIHSGSVSGRQISFKVEGIDNPDTEVEDPFEGPSVSLGVPAGQWKYFDIPLSSLVTPAMHGVITSIVWNEDGGSAQPPFYLDEISFVRLAPAPPPPLPQLSVDASTERHAISPDIYGVNGATISSDMASKLRLPVRRWGGNATSRYNYTIDVTNHAADWYFMNATETDPDLDNGKKSWENFVLQDRATGTKTLMTVPMIGYVAKDSGSCSFTSAAYPNQTSFADDCGNGLLPDPSDPSTTIPLFGSSPTDTSIEVTPSFVQGWVHEMVQQFGTAANGGVAYYNLDNEPMLWNDTHRDVHPQPTSYDEIRDRTYAYAAAIKAEDQTAKTLGPAEWGWTAYFYSALDKAPGGAWWSNPQDRNAPDHQGLPFVVWYLQQMKNYEQAHNMRILDYLDLHYYPSGEGVSQRTAGDTDTQERRLRATRSLWDPYYIEEESWVNEEPVKLIPRMRKWVNENYPGTKLSISEYNFGALEDINGALAEADALGIFGREGLDLATLWWYASPHQETFELHHPAAFAFRMYRNYDDAGHGFGDTSVKANSTVQDRLSVYAAERSIDGALTIMVINKSGESLTSPLALSEFIPSGAAEVYRYSRQNLGAIVREPDQAVTSAGFTATYPPDSMTLFVIPGT